MNSQSNYQQASIKTANDLRSIAQSQPIRDLSRLSLPEINAVVDLTAQIVPAGNVPGMIVSGLARIPGQRLPLQTVQQHITILFKGVEQILDQVAYGAFFAGPAAVIWGYQNLLKLAGKDPESSFPEGVWQFYVDYALREDTARHVNETHGFHTLLQQHGIRLSETDRITAWVMAAISCLHQYDALLEIEWYERVATSTLRELTRALPDATRYASLYREWEIQRPYRRGAEAAHYDYPGYRRVKFDHFLEDVMRDLPPSLRENWQTQIQTRTQQELPAYRRQMSILAYLDPGPYGEIRTPFLLEQAKVGLIYQGKYYLMPACAVGTDQPLGVETVRAQIAALRNSSSPPTGPLAALVRVKRSALSGLRRKLNPSLQKDLQELRFAPILLNFDQRSVALPLTELRQTERGIGDHALTIFNTEKTVVFDQSHIFFDGILGAALAEIMTNEALSWAVYLNTLTDPRPAAERLYLPLVFPFEVADLELIRQAPSITPEAGAETDKVNLKACLTLRKLFKQRNSLLQLTVNDLLLLYRAIHAAQYRPSAELAAELKKLAADPSTRALATDLRHALERSRRENPSVLVPIDASKRIPRERIYPLSMEVPLMELDLLNLHRRVIETLDAYETARGDRSAAYADFDHAQRTYLATLAGLGAIITKLKEIATQGESASVGAIKLLAHLPPALQHLLDKVPERFEMLNNMLKGREVFSNVGAVVPSSTLTRFVTAKDDNEQKQLVWGVLTDASGSMHISLRDFRPHVAALLAIGRKDLADLIAQDYLDAYTSGVNAFVRDLQRITIASRKTRILDGRARR